MCQCRRNSEHVFGGMNQDIKIISDLHARKKRLPVKSGKKNNAECYAIKINGKTKQFNGFKIVVYRPEKNDLGKIAKTPLQTPEHTVIVKNRENATQTNFLKRETHACSNRNYRTNCLRTFAQRKELKKTNSPNIKLMSQLMAAQIEYDIEKERGHINHLKSPDSF